MDSDDLENFIWLLSEDAAALLKQAQAQFAEGVNVVRMANSLRKQTTAIRSAMIMEQAQLRLRGRTKFARAEEMFFTKRGLEQATSESIARYKAQRFNGVESVADICCGIGGDLFGLMERESSSQTVGIDSDPVTALFAAHNGQLINQATPAKVQVNQIQFERFAIDQWQGVHCDPDRRVNERTVLGSRFSPPLPEIFDRIQKEQYAAIKVAPATPCSNGWPEMEREWIGDRRECKQQVLWLGRCCQRPGVRVATMVDGKRVFQLSGDEESLHKTIEITNSIQSYLYEPHATVLAAGLTNVLASVSGVARMAVDIDYLTSAQPTEHPMMAAFEVKASFPLNFKRLSQFLESHSVGQIEVKNRGGSKLVFDKLQRLKREGKFRATIVLTRIGVQQWIAICRRSSSDLPD
jgi:hypothetical protein